MLEKDKHIRIDFEPVVDAHTKIGGSRYTMILEGALRARAMVKRRDDIDRRHEKLHKYGFKPINQALADMVEDYKTT